MPELQNARVPEFRNSGRNFSLNWFFFWKDKWGHGGTVSKRSLPQLASHCFNGSTFKRFCVLARLIGGDRTARATLRIRRMHPKLENPLAFTTKTDEEWQRIPWRPFNASQMENATKRVVQTQPNLKKNPMNVAKKKRPSESISNRERETWNLWESLHIDLGFKWATKATDNKRRWFKSRTKRQTNETEPS